MKITLQTQSAMSSLRMHLANMSQAKVQTFSFLMTAILMPKVVRYLAKMVNLK